MSLYIGCITKCVIVKTTQLIGAHWEFPLQSIMTVADRQHNSLRETPYSPVKSLVIALFCLRAEQMSSSQGGRNSWWLARSSAMVLGEPGEDRWSPSPSWQPSSMESTNRNRDCWGGFTFKRGKRTHLGKEGIKKKKLNEPYQCNQWLFHLTKQLKTKNIKYTKRK